MASTGGACSAVTFWLSTALLKQCWLILLPTCQAPGFAAADLFLQVTPAADLWHADVEAFNISAVPAGDISGTIAPPSTVPVGNSSTIPPLSTVPVGDIRTSSPPSFTSATHSHMDRSLWQITQRFMGISREWQHVQDINAIPGHKGLLRLFSSYGGGPLVVSVGGSSTDKQDFVPSAAVFGALKQVGVGAVYVLQPSAAALHQMHLGPPVSLRALVP